MRVLINRVVRMATRTKRGVSIPCDAKKTKILTKNENMITIRIRLDNLGPAH